MTRGKLYIGTSGFAYPDWAPVFYPAGTRANQLLESYSDRLNSVELNNTFYQQPTPDKVAAWLAATPTDFRFVVKAQRGGSMRAFGEAANADSAAGLLTAAARSPQAPAEPLPASRLRQTMEWLTTPYGLFGERLGAVLYRVPSNMHRTDDKLRALLDAWPADMPLVAELQHESWQSDEVFDLLRAHNASLCATDLDESATPDLRLTGPLIYLRLRRTSYTDEELHTWAGRLMAFLESGTDCFVFFRHDESGVSALRAVSLLAAMKDLVG